MADNYLWDSQSPNPTINDKNPSPSAIDIPPTSRVHGNSCSNSKAVKLALGLIAVASVIALGVVKPKFIQKAVVAEYGTKSTKQELDTSSGPPEAKVKIVSSCSDLQKDITEALMHYIDNYIKNEAEINESYASCDPDNDNWMAEYYGYDDSYYDYNDETAEANETVIKKKKMPKSSKQTRSSLPKSSKQTRSSLPFSLQKQTRSSNQSGRTKTNGNEAKAASGFEQNSQNDNVNERDKVVSDGRFIFAAYGDVLQVWSAHGSTEEVSITQMPGDVKDCDPDKTELCISSTKPSIQALFLGNGRLIAVVSQNFDLYGTFDPSQFFDATKLAVIVYDVSDVTLGSPLNELAHKELPGSFIGGGSIGDKAVIVTSTDVHAFTWAVTEAVERSQPQYCGLNTTAYIELAKSTIKSLSFESTAKQMVTALDNANGCSDIVHVSTMQVGSIDNVPDLTESDFLLGSFVQLFTLDVSSAAGEIPATVTKTFSPSGFNLYLNGYNPYLTNDFVALPSTIYNYNSTTDRSYSSTFILGFGLSADGDFKLFSFGRTPGDMYNNNYRMDKKDGYLRIMTSDFVGLDEVTCTSTYLSKIYVLELPSTFGAMALVGESKLFGEDGSHYVLSGRFSGDLAFLSGDDSSYTNPFPFVAVDISDPTSPKTVGSLQTNCSLSYLEEIDLNGASYILGIGTETDRMTYQSYGIILALIDVSTPSEPKLAAYHKSEPASYTSIEYDYSSVRYFNGSLIIPVYGYKYNTTYITSAYMDEFVVYDISETTITPALNVTHSTEYISCMYDAAVPPRSFVVNSELTTIKDHTAIRTDMAGNVLSELDLDKGFNYSFCGR